jgi:hypothetical protein
MTIATGTVVDGRVVVEGETRTEGATVTVLLREDEEGFELTPGEEEEILESIAQIERGEFVSDEHPGTPSPPRLTASLGIRVSPRASAQIEEVAACWRTTDPQHPVRCITMWPRSWRCSLFSPGPALPPSTAVYEVCVERFRLGIVCREALRKCSPSGI